MEWNFLYYETIGIIIGAKFKQENKLLMQMKAGRK